MEEKKEPAIKKTIKPFIKEQIPLHFDEDTYEIIDHKIPNEKQKPVDKTSISKKKNAPSNIYFYLCIIFWIVMIVELVGLVYEWNTINEKNDTITLLETKIEGFKNEIPEKDNKSSSLETEIEGYKSKIAVKDGTISSLEEKLKYIKESNNKLHILWIFFDFEHEISSNSVQIFMSIPEEEIFQILDIDKENIIIEVQMYHENHCLPIIHYLRDYNFGGTIRISKNDSNNSYLKIVIILKCDNEEKKVFEKIVENSDY